LKPGESVELAAKADVNVELSGAFKGRLRVERKEDGSFEITVEGETTGGVGSAGAGAARVGVAAGTKFHVGNAGEAADLCDALFKGAVVTTASSAGPFLSGVTLGLKAAGMRSDLLDATDRVQQYLRNVSEVKVAAVGKLQLGDSFKAPVPGFGFKAAAAKAGAEVRDAWVVDVSKGQLRHEVTVGLSADVSAGIPFMASVGSGGKASLTMETAYTLPKDVLQRLQDGRLTLTDALREAGAAALTPTVSLAAEVETSGKTVELVAGEVKLKAKATLPLTAETLMVGNAYQTALAALDSTKWSLEAEVGAGGGLNSGIGFGVVAGEVSAMRKKRVKIASGLGTQEAMKQVVSGAEAPSFEAQRAVASLR
jgi:hypothetical protein